MKKIYLLSGPGTIEGFSKILLDELENDLRGTKTISFIASSPNNHQKNLNYIYGTNEITGIINHLKVIHSFEQINVIDELNKSKKMLINSDVIYLLGGNYETQLNFIKENNFEKILKDFNGVLLCASCGAMNVAKKGYYSKDEDKSVSFFYEGIGLVDITIDPHFDINNREQVEEAKRMSVEQKIYGVPNESGIKIEKKQIKKIGKVYVFDNQILNDGD